MGKVIQMRGWKSRKTKGIQREALMSKLDKFLKKADKFFELANKRREEHKNGNTTISPTK